MTTTLPPVSTGRLGNGLARCSVTIANRNGEKFACTTSSEYGIPGDGATARTPAIRPPPPARVMHRSRDEKFPTTSHSHAVLAAAVAGRMTTNPPLAAGCKGSFSHSTASSNHISADRRLETRSTTTGENFRRTARSEVVCLARKPAADPSRFRHYCTSDDWTATPTTCSLPSFHGAGLRKRYVVTENAGCCPITGVSGRKEISSDEDLPSVTTNSATYHGHQGNEKRVQTCRKHSSHLSSITHGKRKSSVVKSHRESELFPGDPGKVKEHCTTNMASYQPPQPATPTGHAYSRAAAVSAFLHSSVHLGSSPSFSSPSPSSPQPEVGQPGREEEKERIHRNASFLPQGDLDAERVKTRLSHSTTSSTHRPPPAGSYPTHIDSSKLHTASSIFLGHTHHSLALPSSTMATSYLPRPAHTQRVRAPPKDNIPFDYYPGHLLNSTAASSYRAHVGDLRHSLPPATLRNLKMSHW